MCHLTFDIGHDFFLNARKVAKSAQKKYKQMAKKFHKVQKSVKRPDILSIGATICTHLESWCVQHARFLLNDEISFGLIFISCIAITLSNGQDFKDLKKKSHIQETPTLLASADSSTDTMKSRLFKTIFHC